MFEKNEIDWRMPFCPEPPDWNLDWGAIVAEFDWLAPMESCHQDPIWHAEGNVLVHTQMVCQALVEDGDWRALSPLARSVLFAAALFHDISKPETTLAIDGRIKAPKHAPKGSRKARKLLYQKLLPTNSVAHYHVREQIADLVLHHGMPLHVADHSQQRDVIRVSQYCRLDWLAMLSRADVQGRICDDQQEMLERIEMFRELCRDAKCYDSPRAFASNQTRFKYFAGKWDDPDSPVYENPICHSILMSGLPGSGKDTWMAQNNDGYKIISLDAIRRQLKVSPTDNQGPIASVAKERAQTFLRAGESFIWNATNLTRDMRAQLIRLFAGYNSEVTIQYIESPWSKLVKQNNSRDDVVPSKIIDEMLLKLEPPKVIEAANVAHHVHD